MRTLGVVLAGGQSRRFGSDKAAAMIGGMTLLDRAAAAIRPFCEEVATVGRSWHHLLGLEDWPRPGTGPLGGIAGALHYARQAGYDRVLSVPVDCGPLPGELLRQLDPAPAFLDAQPVIGLWPAAAADPLQAMLLAGGSRAVRRFCELIDARAVSGLTPANINSPGDLAQFAEMPGNQIP